MTLVSDYLFVDRGHSYTSRTLPRIALNIFRNQDNAVDKQGQASRPLAKSSRRAQRPSFGGSHSIRLSRSLSCRDSAREVVYAEVAFRYPMHD